MLELREQVQELAGVRADLASALQQVNAGNDANEQVSATVYIYICVILILLHTVIYIHEIHVLLILTRRASRSIKPAARQSVCSQSASSRAAKPRWQRCGSS